MASLGDVLVNKVLGHSDAEKAFRPWWDNLEDYLTYGLVMLGLVVAPTAIINSTPLDCTLCQNDEQCPDEKYREEDRDQTQLAGVKGKEFNIYWVKKYCTMTAVDGFIMYFPYLLLLMALFIVLIERVFVRIFKAGMKLDMFYNLLVKETLEENEEVKAGIGQADIPVAPAVDLENSKIAIEVSQSFAQSSNYFYSYLLRTILELCLAVALLTWLLLTGLPSMQRDEFIHCKVYGVKFECAGHPQQFYMCVLIVTLVILALYLLCCAYNLLWLVFPGMRTLSRMMTKYRNVARQNAKHKLTDNVLLGELHTFYYRNRDLKLLLDLLAESSGIAPSIRIMSLFDKEFRSRAEVTNLKLQRTGDAIAVEFEDAPTLTDIFAQIDQVSCIYTAEIRPATCHSSCVAFKFGQAGAEPGPALQMSPCCSCLTSMSARGADAELKAGGDDCCSGEKKKRTVFRGLDPKKQYTVRICTVVNGRAIAKTLEAVEPATTAKEE